MKRDVTRRGILQTGALAAAGVAVGSALTSAAPLGAVEASPKLKGFVEQLLSDPKLWARMRVEPRAVVREAGLSEGDYRLLTEGPIEQLQQACGMKPGECYSVVMVW